MRGNCGRDSLLLFLRFVIVYCWMVVGGCVRCPLERLDSNLLGSEVCRGCAVEISMRHYAHVW